MDICPNCKSKLTIDEKSSGTCLSCGANFPCETTSLDSSHETSDSLYLCRKGDRAIRKFSNYSFIQNYSKYILLSDKEIKNYLISIVKGTNNAKWITTEVQSKQGVDDKIAILYNVVENLQFLIYFFVM